MKEMSFYQIGIVLLALFIHFIADFPMQDETWAKRKSKDFDQLLNHTLTYSGFWFGCGVLLVLYEILFLNLDIDTACHHMRLNLIFSTITFLIHTTTDYFTSKITSRQYAAGHFGSSIPNWGFFTTIGFDQWLHAAQLLLTLKFVCTLA